MNEPHLDHSIRRAVATIVSRAPEPDATPTSASSPTETPARSLAPVLAVAAGLVALLVGFLVIVSGRGDDQRLATPPSSSVPSTVIGDDPLAELLFPTGIDVTPGAASVTDATGSSGAGLIDPNGDLFLLGSSPHALGVEGPNWGGRTIGDLEVRQGQEDQAIVYAVWDECWAFSVNTLSGGVWDADVSALFASITVSDGAVSVSRPNGWESLGGGAQGLTYVLAVSAGGTDLALLQAPDTALGALIAQRSNATAQPVDIDGTAGWLLESDDGRYVAWMHGEVAVMLGGADAPSAGELVALASELTVDHAPAWSTALIDAAQVSALDDVTPMPTTTSVAYTPSDECDAPTIDVES